VGAENLRHLGQISGRGQYTGEHRGHDPRTGGAPDRGQAGDDKEDRDQHGHRADQDAEHAAVGEGFAAFAEAQPRCGQRAVS
jgi:hypothetical protein